MRAIRARTCSPTAAPDRHVRPAAVAARRKFVGQEHYSPWRSRAVPRSTSSACYYWFRWLPDKEAELGERRTRWPATCQPGCGGFGRVRLFERAVASLSRLRLCRVGDCDVVGRPGTGPYFCLRGAVADPPA